MLIDCDTCTVRGEGCADCVVSVLLGAPPGWQDTGPTVVPLTRRTRGVDTTAGAGARRADRPAGHHDSPGAPGHAAGDCDVAHVDTVGSGAGQVVELDEVERRAVRALADFGLVPPLRHQDAAPPPGTRGTGEDRSVS